MVTRQDTAERVTVVGVKDGGKKFKATRPNGEVQEFTLSVSNPVPCPAMDDDIIVHFSIQTPTDPDKIARFGSEPTWWANKIEPARGDGYSAPPMADVAPAYEETAQRVDQANAAHKTAEPKKDVYQVEGDARNQSIEMQVCLKAAVEITNQWDGGVASAQVIEVALALHDGIFCGKAMPTHDEAMAAHDGWPTDATTPVQQGEPEPQYSG